MSLALSIVLAGVVLGLVAAGAGVLRIVFESRAFKKRLDEVAKLPFLPTLELTQARLDIASRRIETVPALEARTRRAIADIQAARARVESAVANVKDAIGAFVLGP